MSEVLARILIVEDEPKVAAFIKMGLEESNFQVKIAYDGMVGKAMAFSNEFDLIILDINLPIINGLILCKLIRENNIQIPILMLTALGGIDEKVIGFNNGADDYLLKPFEFAELILRMNALLRRSRFLETPGRTLTLADLELNRDSKTVVRADRKIDLSVKEFTLLEYMMLNKDRIISRFELTENVWGINFDTGTNVVDVYVNFLRKKMDTGFPLKLIHTKTGYGYVFSAEEFL